MAAAGFTNISTLPQTDILGPSRTPIVAVLSGCLIKLFEMVCGAGVLLKVEVLPLAVQ